MTRELWTVIPSDVPNLYFIGETRLSGRKQEAVNRTRYYKRNEHFEYAHDSHYYPSDGFYYEYVNSGEVQTYRNLAKQVQPNLDIAKNEHNLKPITKQEVGIMTDKGELESKQILSQLDKELEKQNRQELWGSGFDQFLESGQNAFDDVIEPITRTSQVIQGTVQDTTELVSELLIPLGIFGAIILIAVLKK